MVKKFWIAVKTVWYNNFYKPACKYTVLPNLNRNKETGTEIDYEK